MSRALAIGFLLSGLVLLGLAAFEYVVPADDHGVIIDDLDREFPDVVAGERIPVSFSIHNPTRHTVRVVGLAKC
jgi:hypothetical protein